MFLRPVHSNEPRENLLHFHRGKHGDLIRVAWHVEGGKPEFDTDDDAHDRGRRVNADVLGAKKLLHKLQTLADQAAV